MNQYNKKKVKKISDQKGFTLVELLVALTLFVITVLAAISSLYTVNNASRKVQAMRTVMDNVQFTMESMSRTIRTGREYECDVSSYCLLSGGPSKEISFKNTLGTPTNISYRLYDQKVQRQITENGSTQPWIDLTSPEVKVERLSFYVEKPTGGQSTQPRVFIFMSGTATTQFETAPFALQTMVSQRAIE